MNFQLTISKTSNAREGPADGNVARSKPTRLMSVIFPPPNAQERFHARPKNLLSYVSRLVSPSLLSVLLTLFACTSPTPPPPPPPPPPPDTTSHDFVWRVDTLGDGNSSILYDVAIIDENNIWAVGEMYMRDSTGAIDPTPYGLAKWNGVRWSVETVPYRDFGSAEKYPGPLFTIQAFAANDIYVCTYASLLHWNGSVWTEKAFFMTSIPFENQILKMWGSDGNNIYCVGRKGGIFHFNGTTWSRIESGTTLGLYDVWGMGDEGEQRGMVLAIQSDFSSQHRFLILSPSGAIDTMRWTRPEVPASVWFASPGKVYASGSGLWRYSDGAWMRLLPTIFLNRVRGSGENNIFACGSFAYIAHFNGSTWREYPHLQNSGAVLRGLAVGRRHVVAVGNLGGRPFSIIGTQD